MELRPPIHPPVDTGRVRDAREAFRDATRALLLQAVRLGWRESEAALALADAADDYVMFLAQKPKRDLKAANSN